MVSTFLLLTLGIIFSQTWATSSLNTLVVHEHLNSIPGGFVHKGLPSPGTILTLRIALVSNNLAGLETALYDVSTPSSALYGQHLTKEEVESFVTPTSDTTIAMNEWLTSNDLHASPISPAGDWLSVSVDAEKANEIFAANFSVFTHQATGRDSIRTLSYSIPASLRGHIDFVHPTIAFPVYTSGPPLLFTPVALGNSSTIASCDTLVTPACLQEQYGLNATAPPPAPGQNGSHIGVSAFFNQWAQVADLNRFLIEFRPDLDPTTTFGLQTVDGGINPQGVTFAGLEADLDIQYTVGVAGLVPATFISVGNNTHDGIQGFLDIINFLLSENSPPQVLTTSYGFDEPGVAPSIAHSLCNAYMQLGARGVSILFASGDGGVSGGHPQSCTTFVPTFPSGCPFVTSVGGTTGVNPEVSAEFSSGGFSNLFLRPAYQATAVSNYLSFLGSANSSNYNMSGRGFPDVAAQAENVVIFQGGVEGTVFGTSCSSPIFASAIALLNAELMAAGRSVLGFLNPFIYANQAVFHDITMGNNPGCGTNGFPATTGWDPVTGFGSPNYTSMRIAVGL